MTTRSAVIFGEGLDAPEVIRRSIEGAAGPIGEAIASTRDPGREDSVIVILISEVLSIDAALVRVTARARAVVLASDVFMCKCDEKMRSRLACSAPAGKRHMLFFSRLGWRGHAYGRAFEFDDAKIGKA